MTSFLISSVMDMGFNDRQPAGIACVFASLATSAAIKRDPIKNARSMFKSEYIFRRVCNRFLAVRANSAHQALGRRPESRRTKSGRAQYPCHRVARSRPARHCNASCSKPGGRQRRLDRDFSGLGIANFTDHDNVRVLTQDERKALAKVSPISFFNRHLVNTGI